MFQLKVLRFSVGVTRVVAVACISDAEYRSFLSESGPFCIVQATQWCSSGVASCEYNIGALLKPGETMTDFLQARISQGLRVLCSGFL